MNVSRKIRRWLAPRVLRGPIAKRWVGGKTRKLEEHFLKELVWASEQKIAATPTGPVQPGGKLRRILLIGDFMWEAIDLVPELAKICDVVALDLRPNLKKNAEGSLPSETVLATVREFVELHPGLDPDVLFFYARGSLLSEEVFDVLRKRWSCPLLGMNLDDKFEFLDYGIFASGNENYQKWAKHFDLNITNGIAAYELYKLLGLPAIYSPQGVHQPRGLTMPVSAHFKYRVGFLGSCKPERLYVMNRLREVGIEVAVFGSGWQNSKWVDNTAETFRSTQINLGIGFASSSLRLTTTKGRDFECPGTGACYLTTYNWELTQHYEIGKEILCYREIEELIEMIAYYRPRPEECLKIAQAAWRRCTNEHTWEKRFRRIFQQMGFAGV